MATKFIYLLIYFILGNGLYETKQLGRTIKDAKFARLISVGMTFTQAFCLKVTSVNIGQDITIIVYRRTNTSLEKIQEIKSSTRGQRTHHVFIPAANNPAPVSQVALNEVQLAFTAYFGGILATPFPASIFSFLYRKKGEQDLGTRLVF